MEFLGQVTNGDMGLEKLVFTGSTFLSGMWGWEDPDSGNEYAIVGTTSGVAFVRVTDPTAPEFLGIVPTTNSGTTRNFWWDIKTFNNHAYWTTEVNEAGVGIFNLNRLDGLSAVDPGTFIPADARFGDDGPGGYVRAHNIAINEDSGRAYLVGVTQDGLADDAIVILDLNGDPLVPIPVGVIEGADVDAHDVQVVTYNGPDDDPVFGHVGDEILVNFNGTELNIQIWDVSDPANPVFLSQSGYPGASFAHQGWLTGDHKYVVFGDEEDELFGISDPRNPDLPDTARTYFCDISDLDGIDCNAPMTFDSPAASIDHNLFVGPGPTSDSEFVYQANYTAGIRVLEITRTAGDITSIAEVAHMDTEPRLPNNNMNHNINIFVGPWGVYPFFDSGTIAASDGLNGLVLMALDLP
jgi:choice-of-anchor B domain-containing protein